MPCQPQIALDTVCRLLEFFLAHPLELDVVSEEIQGPRRATMPIELMSVYGICRVARTDATIMRHQFSIIALKFQ